MQLNLQQQLAERFSWQRPAGVALYSALIVIASIVVVLKVGRDTPWDFFSYHAYSAHLLFHDRLAQDYFAAGLQGYMNPIGFLPFALAQLVGLNSIGIGVVLAATHALNGIFLLLICRSLARLANDGATLSTWSVAGAVRRALRDAGFCVEKRAGFAGKRGRLAPGAAAGISAAAGLAGDA